MQAVEDCGRETLQLNTIQCSLVQINELQWAVGRETLQFNTIEYPLVHISSLQWAGVGKPYCLLLCSAV